jgi:hypothetical protein
MATKFLRKRHLRERYGDVTDRTLERMVQDGRLPPPEFPFANRIPAWREETLDAHDRRAVVASRPGRDAAGVKAA